MNLFYKPAISQLALLIEKSTQNSPRYHILVDYDGEVLIDSNANLTSEALLKFKFYFVNMNQGSMNGYLNDRYLIFLNQLYKNLIFCWEKDICGEVDFYVITQVRKRVLNSEINEQHELFYPHLLKTAN